MTQVFHMHRQTSLSLASPRLQPTSPLTLSWNAAVHLAPCLIFVIRSSCCKKINKIKMDFCKGKCENHPGATWKPTPHSLTRAIHGCFSGRGRSFNGEHAVLIKTSRALWVCGSSCCDLNPKSGTFQVEPRSVCTHNKTHTSVQYIPTLSVKLGNKTHTPLEAQSQKKVTYSTVWPTCLHQTQSIHPSFIGTRRLRSVCTDVCDAIIQSGGPKVLNQTAY